MSSIFRTLSGGNSFCASLVEEVLQQHTGTLSDVFASRKAEESVARRYQAARWLRVMLGVVPSRVIPNEPTEEEFRLALRSGWILCSVFNKIHPGAISKVVENPADSTPVPDGAALSAYQYFENVRNFLVAVQETGLPSFEASDLEQGGSITKVVDCVLALKSYSDWKQSGGIGSWRFGGSLRPLPHGKCIVRGKSFDLFMNPSSFRNIDLSEQPNGTYHDIFSGDHSLEASKMFGGAHPPQSLLCSLLSNRRPEEVPILVESILRKIMEEFELRLARQNEQKPIPKEEAFAALMSTPEDLMQNPLPKEEATAAHMSPAEDITEESALPADKAISAPGKQMREEDSCVPLKNKEEDEQKIQRQMSLFDEQQREIMELKHVLQMTKAGIRLMQTKYSEDFCHLGIHLQSLSYAASGYHKVLEENRQLYNQIQDLKGSIRVYCRVRPFVGAQSSSMSTVDSITDGNITVVNPLKQDKGSRRSFNFNKVFGPSASQEEVFSDTKPLIRSVLDGYNVCIFAYGQTGSGKTHTMTGPPEITKETQGVNFRALNDLFEISEQRKDAFCYNISVQMIEIYNEHVRDLLDTDGLNKKIEIRNNSQNGFNVPEANLVPVSSPGDVIELMNVGQRNRAVGATALNVRSSRSHSCLTVHVQGKDLISGLIVRGCLHLVDLAGSERLDKSEATGERLKEAQHINKSLSALGDVIAALAQKNSHIPYRNSKLTQLLQDSLGGQAKTLMFVHMSPEVDAFGETISTLKFAERVASVELGAAKLNKESGEVRELKEQIVSLKLALAQKEAESGQVRNVKHTPERRAMKHASPSRTRLDRQGSAEVRNGVIAVRQATEDGNFRLQSNILDQQGSNFDQQEPLSDTSSPPWPDNGIKKLDERETGSGDWVDKVMLSKQESANMTPIRCWDNNDDSSLMPEMFYRGQRADMRKVYPEQYDRTPASRHFDSGVDDSEEIELGTSDSSETDLQWQSNGPMPLTIHNSEGPKTKKSQSKLPAKSPDTRHSSLPHGTPLSRKPYHGSGGQNRKQQLASGADTRRHAGKSDINGTVK